MEHVLSQTGLLQWVLTFPFVRHVDVYTERAAQSPTARRAIARDPCLALAADLAGVLTGPADLSSDARHLEGYGGGSFRGRVPRNLVHRLRGAGAL